MTKYKRAALHTNHVQTISVSVARSIEDGTCSFCQSNIGPGGAVKNEAVLLISGRKFLTWERPLDIYLCRHCTLAVYSAMSEVIEEKHWR